MGARKILIAGNWKMNLNTNESIDLVNAIKENTVDYDDVDRLVAPPFTALQIVKDTIADSGILLSAQNMHHEQEGAYTGEISGEMLVGTGCSHIILGHSERRTLFKETDEEINQKLQAAIRVGLIPIICIGETLEQRESGKAFHVIKEQLDKSLKTFFDKSHIPSSTILAYEPVWAIGTGKTATPEQAQEVHLFIRDWIKENFNEDTANQIRILYGGSVKPANAKDLMSKPDIDGALVGGASLKEYLFIPIIKFKES